MTAIGFFMIFTGILGAVAATSKSTHNLFLACAITGILLGTFLFVIGITIWLWRVMP